MTRMHAPTTAVAAIQSEQRHEVSTIQIHCAYLCRPILVRGTLRVFAASVLWLNNRGCVRALHLCGLDMIAWPYFRHEKANAHFALRD